MNDTQVLIVGAGPIGLTAAAFLTHYGIKCRIIDKNEHQTLTSNAVGIQARTLELFEEIGLTQKLLDSGRKISTLQFICNKVMLPTIDLSLIDSQYNFVCDTPQNETEQHLIDYLAKQCVIVERNTLLTGVTEQEQGVIASINIAGAEQTITADWLIACDGYHSSVRPLCDIAYEGVEFKYHFIMIDAPVQSAVSLDTTYLATHKGVVFMIFPMLNSARLIAEIGRSKEFANTDATQSTFQEIAKLCCPFELKIGEPRWQSKFYVHERLAASFRKKRVFLAGDAAHSHIPAAAQGMNTGMQDAINLSWKLALVIQGRVSSSLLDTYNQERRPVVQDVLKLTGRMAKSLFIQNKFIVAIRTFVMKRLFKVKSLQKTLLDKVAEISINYANSKLSVGKRFGSMQPGQRIVQLPVPNLNGKFLILDFTGDITHVLSKCRSQQIVSIYPVAKDDKALRQPFGNIAQGYCVVRPDRYIGYLGADKKQLIQYFERFQV